MLELKNTHRVVRAGYKPVEEEVLTKSNEPLATVQDTPEKTPNNEVNIKVHCTNEELVSLQTGVWLLGGTKQEKPVSSWKKVQTPEGDSILTAKCFENEDKVLHHNLFLQSGQSCNYQIKPNPEGSEKLNAEFVPVKLAVQTSERRLGWATDGFFYHFLDGKLSREFQVAKQGRSTYQATFSDDKSLTSDLQSEHHYGSILLPYKVEGSPAPTQHILYRKEKLTESEFQNLNDAWLNDNAMKVDMDKVIESRQSELIYRDPSRFEFMEMPSPIEQFEDVHAYGNIWGRYNNLEINEAAVNITESNRIPKNVPVLNPTNMYWPPYNFLTREKIHIEYEKPIDSAALLSLDEAKEFYENIGGKNTVGDVKNVGSLGKGLIDAEYLARGLGGLGVKAYTKEIKGFEYIIIKDYKKHAKTLEKGHKWRSNNPRIVQLGLGLNDIKGASRYVKMNVGFELAFAIGVNAADYILRDETTLADFVGNSAGDLAKGFISFAGAALVTAIVVPAAAGVLVTGAVFAIASFAFGYGLNMIDNEQGYSKDMSDALRKHFQ